MSFWSLGVLMSSFLRIRIRIIKKKNCFTRIVGLLGLRIHRICFGEYYLM